MEEANYKYPKIGFHIKIQTSEATYLLINPDKYPRNETPDFECADDDNLHTSMREALIRALQSCQNSNIKFNRSTTITFTPEWEYL